MTDEAKPSREPEAFAETVAREFREQTFLAVKESFMPEDAPPYLRWDQLPELVQKLMIGSMARTLEKLGIRPPEKKEPLAPLRMTPIPGCPFCGTRVRKKGEEP